jgi:rod shape-determining protein MreC
LLRRQLLESYSALSPKKIHKTDTLNKQQYTYIPSTVINSTYDKRNNFLTLNGGFEQGIKEGMGVFNSQGVVGVIFKVSRHFSLVRTLLTEQINIDVLLPNGTFGILKWNGKDPTICQISGVPNDIRLHKGDKVVSNGGQNKFPRNYSIGTIDSYEKINGSPRWKINIKLSVDFRKITQVYIVQNLLGIEQQKLESKKNDEK